MKVLITGASGFIGSFLVDEALQKGWEVWAGVRKNSNKSYLTNPSIHFIDLNYSDPTALLQQLKIHRSIHGAWDYIIHNAGITKCADKSDYQRINYLYTVHLIQALLNSGNTPRKFLYMSSMGAVGPGDEHNGKPLNHSIKPNPISEYGRSKLRSEEFIRSLSDFPWIILRPTGVYGPRESDYYVMLKMIKAGFDVSVGLKQQLLNFIYIKDLTRVCFTALESSLLKRTWFVADGEIYTSKAFSNLIQETLSIKRILTIRIPLSIVKVVSIVSGVVSRLTGKPTLLNPDKYRVLKQRNWTCDITELERDLNFKPQYNLRKGMEETIAWYKKNGWL